MKRPLSATALAAIAVLASFGTAQRHDVYRLPGLGDGHGYGSRLAAPGDVNGDSFPEVLVGAHAGTIDGFQQGYVHLVSGRDGTVLFELKGAKPLDWFGWQVAAGGDIDKDSVPDLLVSSLQSITGGDGRVEAFSGKTGKRIHLWKGTAAATRYGNAIAGVGDLDGDGYHEVLVGAPDAEFLKKSKVGTTVLYNGQDGKLLRTDSGDTADDRFGHALAVLGDIDNDKANDWIVLAETGRKGASGGPFGFIRLVSGKTGKTLWTEFATASFTFVDARLTALEDVDKDGKADWAVGNPLTKGPGAVEVHSGATGKLLFRLDGTLSGGRFGESLGGMADLDGDGRGEILVGSRMEASRRFDAGAVQVLSGKDGAVLLSLFGTRRSERFGAAVCGTADVNADDAPDFVAGVPGARVANGDAPGAIYWASGKRLSLAISTYRMSILHGGAQVMELDGGPTLANKFYLVTGSGSGTNPGFKSGSLTVRLNFDPYMVLTLVTPTQFLFNNLSLLDSQGRGKVAFVLRPREAPTTLAGSVLHHGFLVLGIPVLEFASNPVPLRFELF